MQSFLQNKNENESEKESESETEDELEVITKFEHVTNEQGESEQSEGYTLKDKEEKEAIQETANTYKRSLRNRKERVTTTLSTVDELKKSITTTTSSPKIKAGKFGFCNKRGLIRLYIW
eukprot:Awhi_evm2s3126